MNYFPGIPPKLISHRHIMDDPIPTVPWLIKPLIATGDKALLYGAWGSFKSWLLMHLALHLAAGVSWLDHFDIPKSKKVLYLDEEMSETTFRRRWQQLAHGAGLADVDLSFNLYSQPGIVLNSQGAHTLLANLERAEFLPDVIVGETIRRLLPGNENEAQDVAQFWRDLTPLLGDSRTLILSHHMSKPNPGYPKPVRDRASGSTDIMAGVDAAFAIQKQSSGLLKVEQVKSRATEEVGAFTVRFACSEQDGPVHLSLVSPPTHLQPTTNQEDGPDLDALFQDHEDDTVTTGEIIQYCEQHGQPKRTAERTLKKWSEIGHLEKVKRGQWRKPPAAE